jgi:hypothetical protein
MGDLLSPEIEMSPFSLPLNAFSQPRSKSRLQFLTMRSASLLFFLPFCALHVVSECWAYDESRITMQEGSNKTDFEGYPPTVDERLAAPSPTPLVDAKILNIELPLINVGPLSEKESGKLTKLKEEWFLDFYQRRRHTHRCDCDVRAQIELVEQEVTYDQFDSPTNTITYNMLLTFDGCGPSPSIDGLTPEDIFSLPYENFDANLRLASNLRATVGSLREMYVPLALPEVPKREQLLAMDHGCDGSSDLFRPHASGHVCAGGFGVVVGAFKALQLKMSATAFL